MDKFAYFIIPILITLIGLSLLIVLVLKIAKKNKVVKLHENRIVWTEIRCPNCRNIMEQGYSMAGRGIIWRGKNEKKPGLFSTIGSVLENTASFNSPPALNLSWRCKQCNFLILDNSKMIKLKKA